MHHGIGKKMFLESTQNKCCFNVEFYRQINFDKSTLNQHGIHVDYHRDVISIYINLESTLSVSWEMFVKMSILKIWVRYLKNDNEEVRF